MTSNQYFRLAEKKIHQDVLAVSKSIPRLEFVFRWTPFLSNKVAIKLSHELDKVQDKMGYFSPAIIVIGKKPNSG